VETGARRRNPKAEGRIPKEDRIPKEENRKRLWAREAEQIPFDNPQYADDRQTSAIKFRISGLLRPSDFGLRTSASLPVLENLRPAFLTAKDLNGDSLFEVAIS
jgi:hypothetical protein